MMMKQDLRVKALDIIRYSIIKLIVKTGL